VVLFERLRRDPPAAQQRERRHGEAKKRPARPGEKDAPLATRQVLFVSRIVVYGVADVAGSLGKARHPGCGECDDHSGCRCHCGVELATIVRRRVHRTTATAAMSAAVATTRTRRGTDFPCAAVSSTASSSQILVSASSRIFSCLVFVACFARVLVYYDKAQQQATTSLASIARYIARPCWPVRVRGRRGGTVPYVHELQTSSTGLEQKTKSRFFARGESSCGVFCPTVRRPAWSVKRSIVAALRHGGCDERPTSMTMGMKQQAKASKGGLDY